MSSTQENLPGPMKLFRDGLSATETKELNRSIMALAMPVFIGQGINSMVGFVSRIIMSELGDKAFNSINIGMMVFFLIITVLAAVGVGTTSLVAQNWGLGDRQRAGEILQQSLIYGFFISLVISVFGLAISKVLFSLLGTDRETAEMGVQFLFWLFLGIPLLTPGFFLASALRGAGDTRTPMYAGMVMSVLSLVLSYGLILGKLGMPRLEAVGAALAIDFSFFTFTLILGVRIFSGRTVITVPRKGWRPNHATGMSILKIGLPSATEWILIQLGMLVYISVLTDYGEQALAGYFTGVAVLALAQAVSMGFQTAATTLVGQNIGARNYSKAESTFRKTTYLGFVVMGIIGLLFVFGVNPTVLSFLFRELDSRSIAHARVFIVLLAIVMPLMGVSFSMAGGLRGAGSTVLPLVASIIGVYGGRILFAFLVYRLFHPPVWIVWCSMFPDLFIRISVMTFKLRSGEWKTVKVRL
ncbi:MAG: MATE family efflux transporter [Proteobacteria bacterium]|nr:MATE family efflux transporter [Pseudomonadota bacterium]